ncbi:MAG: flagellar biosynthesis protein FlhF [Verrucomicrobiota bacterium]|jgi:flagellar biosynthesis protein FlhF
MIVRRYRGKSLESLRETVQRELGDAAVIVSSRKLAPEGLVGKIAGAEFEVVAAIDDAASEEHEESRREALVEKVAGAVKPQVLSIRREIKMQDDKLVDLEEKMASICEQLSRLEKRSQQAPTPVIAISGGESKGPFAQLPEEWREAMIAAARLPGAGPGQLLDSLAGHLSAADGILFRRNSGEGPDVFALIGPTGVGKTTTLAKLAAFASLRRKLSCALITLDTFRVGGAEQLREYARLLGADFSVVFSGDELRRQLDRVKDRDVVFIDTQGRASRDRAGLDTVIKILATAPECTPVLTLPANIRAGDAREALKAWGRLDPACLILTKADESACCDGLPALLHQAAIPVVYIAHGQRVPEDLQPARAESLAAMICPELASNPFLPAEPPE